MQSKTKIKLGATAGLRFLPGNKADQILAAVKTYLKTTPFILDPTEGVTILDGKSTTSCTPCLHLCIIFLQKVTILLHETRPRLPDWLCKWLAVDASLMIKYWGLRSEICIKVMELAACMIYKTELNAIDEHQGIQHWHRPIFLDGKLYSIRFLILLSEYIVCP